MKLLQGKYFKVQTTIGVKALDLLKRICEYRNTITNTTFGRDEMVHATIYLKFGDNEDPITHTSIVKKPEAQSHIIDN